MNLGFLAVLAVFVTVALWWASSQPQGLTVSPTLSGKVRYVVDGDSLYISGHKAQVRHWGVDTPESDTIGFDAATRHLTMIAEGRRITCRHIDRDRYGRTVARCFREDGQEINRMMIQSGTAKEYRRYSKGFYSR